MRLIDADALIEELKSDRFPGAPYVGVGLKIAIEKICEAPTIEPERKKGKWIPVTDSRGGYECCECRCYAPSYFDGTQWLSDVCPSCGADMREGNP